MALMTLQMKNHVSNWSLVLQKKPQKIPPNNPQINQNLKHIKHNVDKSLFKNGV